MRCRDSIGYHCGNHLISVPQIVTRSRNYKPLTIIWAVGKTSCVEHSALEEAAPVLSGESGSWVDVQISNSDQFAERLLN